MNSKVIAIIACVAILAVAGGAVAITMNNNSSGNITIEDDAGNIVTLDKPLTNVAVINTNVPIAMKILGLENSVVGMDNSTLKKNNNSTTFSNAIAIGARDAISGEKILESGTKYVISPQKMGITSNVDALKALGITVIYLDCYGDTAMSDLEKLVKLFGQTNAVKEKYDAYKTSL